MRIAVLTSLYPGPPKPFEGIFAERRWLGMHARGHRVSVTQPLPMTPGPLALGPWRAIARMPRREDRGGIPVSRPRYLHLPGRARANLSRFVARGLRELLAGESPDVVVADYAWPAAGAAPELEKNGVPCVVNGRGSDVLQVAGEAGLGDDLARYLKSAGHWCAVSGDLVSAMDRLGEAPGRGHLVPNGVDLSTFSPGDRAAARRDLGLASAGSLVLVCGHLIERKDPLLALEAFARLVRDEPGREARCVFVGRGPLEDQVRKRASELGIEERVELRGEVPPSELASWYAACDVLLLTSRREGRPNVVIEALASGRPVLATAAGGTAELLTLDPGAMLSPDRDPRTLASMLAGLLAAPPGADDLRGSVEHLSWDASLDALEGCLREALEAAA